MCLMSNNEAHLGRRSRNLAMRQIRWRFSHRAVRFFHLCSRICWFFSGFSKVASCNRKRALSLRIMCVSDGVDGRKSWVGTWRRGRSIAVSMTLSHNSNHIFNQNALQFRRKIPDKPIKNYISINHSELTKTNLDRRGGIGAFLATDLCHNVTSFEMLKAGQPHT